MRVPLASNAAISQILGYQTGYHQATGDTDSGYHQATKLGTAEASRKPDGSLAEARTDQATRASLRPESARVLQLFREGLDLAQIVRELKGVSANQGRRYQDAAREVQQLLREAL